MSISRRQLQAIWVPVVVGLLSIPVADGVYRLAGARPSDDLAGLYTSFGDNSYRHRANVSTSTEWFSGPFTVITDDLGLRCGSTPTSRTQPGARVDYLVLGDSQGYGQCLDFEASLVGGLATIAARHSKHVANVSVGGHFLLNQLENARWLHEDQNLSIEHLVVMLTPYMILTAGEYNRAQVGTDGKLYGGEPTLPARLAVWAKTHTTIYGRVRNAVQNVRGQEQDNSMLFRFFDTGEDSRQRTAELLAVLSEIRAWTASIDAGFTVVYTPLAVELEFDGVAALASSMDRQVDPEVPLRQAAEVAEQLDLPLIDLRPALSGMLSAGKTLTCRGDPHYNRETSLACSQWIWDALEPGSPQ